ncbi:hypothetical protein F5Y14DRAFT_455236 [Nemania sp. NC0429]|nr:hypothetical protein F5Y14DRAFT_455236 [Nemania sp. NC0429]
MEGVNGSIRSPVYLGYQHDANIGVTQRETGDMGIGTFATRHFSAGSLIFAERPLLIVPHNNPTSWDVAILQAYNQLSENEKVVYQGLGCNRRAAEYQVATQRDGPSVSVLDYSDVDGMPNDTTLDGPARIAGIYHTNSFDLKIEYGASAVFTRLSRINHSCVPNVVAGGLCGKTGLFYLRTLRDIKAGEELFFGYSQYMGPYEARRRSFPFECQCALCSKPSKTSSDRRRLDIANFVSQLTDYISKIVVGQQTECCDAVALKLANSYLERVRDEDLYEFIPWGYQALAFTQLKNGLRDEAEQSINTAETYERMYWGHQAKSTEVFWDYYCKTVVEAVRIENGEI